MKNGVSGTQWSNLRLVFTNDRVRIISVVLKVLMTW